VSLGREGIPLRSALGHASQGLFELVAGVRPHIRAFFLSVLLAFAQSPMNMATLSKDGWNFLRKVLLRLERQIQECAVCEQGRLTSDVQFSLPCHHAVEHESSVEGQPQLCIFAAIGSDAPQSYQDVLADHGIS